MSVVQSYRNYSRILRQYLHGDSKAYNILQMELRTAFHIPFTCETPVELIKHGAVINKLSLRKGGWPTSWIETTS